MKIALITGSYPPERCGIGDYTCQLVEALSGLGIATDVIRSDDWRVGNFSNVAAAVRAARSDLVHIQYPTVGYGRHVTPQLLSLAIPSVVTLHEVTEAHVLRKLSLLPFLVRSRHVVFTTPGERDFALAFAPWIARRSSVIPIGSNIRTGSGTKERKTTDIVYFGLFRPNKGIDDVIELAVLIKRQGLDAVVHMVGRPSSAHASYYQGLRDRTRDLPVRWSTDLGEEQVADLLSGTAFAYMPFPDGASGRRGSLLALMANGVVTITTRGPQTTPALADAVVVAQGPEQALSLIAQLRADSDRRHRLSETARTYAMQFSWQSIAERHRELYTSLLAGER